MAERKILVLSPLPDSVIEAFLDLRSGGEKPENIKVVSYTGSSKEELLEAVSDAYIIIGDYNNNVAMDADVIRAATNCILIQQPSTGFQHIDIDAAAAEGIPVANIAGANALTVAEHTIMLILACLKKLVLAHEKTKDGEWAQHEMANYGVFELNEKTLGIIGMGLIGKEVTRRARAFGPNMIYYDVNRLSPEEEQELGLSYRPLDDLIAESDVITIHTPLTPETENMINADRIATMKPNAVIINTSRGPVVDEEALARALSEERLQSAGMDVFSSEPVDPDNPVLNASNVVLTPHIAGATNESRLRIINLTIDNVISILRGQEPVNIVNGIKPKLS